MRVSPLNAAAAPTPSAKPAAPLPASVVTLQANAGCAASPAVGHADAGAHGVGASASAGQKAPGGHTSGEPEPQKEPAGQVLDAPTTSSEATASASRTPPCALRAAGGARALRAAMLAREAARRGDSNGCVPFLLCSARSLLCSARD